MDTQLAGHIDRSTVQHQRSVVKVGDVLVLSRARHRESPRYAGATFVRK